MSRLPASPQHLEWPIQTINVDSPPFVPNIRVSSQLQDFLPLISGYSAWFTQEAADKNPIRIFAFNTIANNYWDNDVFDKLVDFVAAYIEMALLKRQYANIDSALDSLGGRLVAGYSCFIADKYYNDLIQFIDQDLENDLNAGIRDFNVLVNELKSFANDQQPARGAGRPAGNGRVPGRPSNNGGRTGSLVRTNTPREDRGTTPTIGSIARLSINSTTGNSMTSTNTPIRSHPSSIQPQAQAPAPRQPVQPVQQQQDEELVWEPTADAPYMLAHNPLTHKSSLIQTRNGPVVQVIEELTQMDEEAHRLTRVYGALPPTAPLRQVIKVAEVSEALELAVNPVNAETELPKVYNHPDMLVAPTVEDAWFQLDLLATTKPDDKVVTSMVNVPSYFLASAANLTRDKAFLSACGKESTYDGMCRLLSEVDDRVDKTLVDKINVLMTQSINRQLMLNMSLVGYAISSFRDDYADLVEVLLENETDYPVEILEKNQTRVLESLFPTQVGEQIARAGTVETMLETLDPKVRNRVLVISSVYKMAIVACDVYELGVELQSDTAMVLTAAFTPLMFAINTQAEPAVVPGIDYSRLLLRTKDSHEFEIGRGYFVQNSALGRYLPKNVM